MRTLAKLGFGILVLSLLVFVILFGKTPALRRGPVGNLHRLLVERLPNALVKLDRGLTNGRLTDAFTRSSRYLIHEGNPVVLCIFLLVLSASVLLFLRACYFELPAQHRLIAPFLIACPYIFTHLSVNTTASYITAANHSSRMHDYPYDHVLFRPGHMCRTCKFEKPARSKHCSFCRACVSRCDHHCPWVNNCLGKENYRWFVALLLSLGVLNVYGAYLSYLYLWPRTQLHDTAEIVWSTRSVWDRLSTQLGKAFDLGGLSIAGVGMLALLTAPLPFGLLAYHIYLIWAGMTTNESEKWKDLQENMADGLAFRCSRDEAPYALSEEPHVRWPVSSDQVIVCTNDGRPPGGHDQTFERVWDLSAVTNIYDLGVVDNLLYILRAR